MSGLADQFLKWSRLLKVRKTFPASPAAPVNAPVNEHNGGYCSPPQGAEGHALHMNGHAPQSPDQSNGEA